MKKLYSFQYERYDHPDQLTERDAILLTEAKKCLSNAYAPYSGFEVGAAVLLDDGTILTGTNQENASYGLCLCAEQNVLARTAPYRKSILALAVTARSMHRKVISPISPCGACRQVISEYEDRHGKPIRIILQGEAGEILIFDSVKDILPFSFSKNDL